MVVHILFPFCISAYTVLDVSQFGIANEEVRAIQAKLYEAAMKQTLTLDTLKTYKEHLDTDIKIVVSTMSRNHCLAQADIFESNFYRRDVRVSVWSIS